MARRFRGESTCKVDAKGRFFLPSGFRRTVEAGDPDFQPGLKPQLVIVYGGDDQPFLEGYSIEAIDEMDAKIARLPSSPLKRRLTQRFSTEALTTDVDGEGRVLLPPKLREKLGIGSEIYLAAWGESFRIWEPETRETHRREEMEEDEAEFRGKDLNDLLDAALADLDKV